MTCPPPHAQQAPDGAARQLGSNSDQPAIVPEGVVTARERVGADGTQAGGEACTHQASWQDGGGGSVPAVAVKRAAQENAVSVQTH